MEFKDFTWQARFAYIYLAFAHITDYDLSDVELQSIKEKIIFWGSEDQEMQDFRNIMHGAIKWYRSNTDEEYRINMVLEIATRLLHEPWFGVTQKNQVIGDLIDIAMVDEKIVEAEKDWIIKIATAWDIDVEF